MSKQPTFPHAFKHGIWHSKEEREQDLESSGIGVVRIELNFLKHRQKLEFAREKKKTKTIYNAIDHIGWEPGLLGI